MPFYVRLREQSDDLGRLTDITFEYPESFNFGYDVVDAIASRTPGKRAMVWCNTLGEVREFTFSEISSLSNRAANVILMPGSP